MIIPLGEEVIFNIVHCPRCKKYFSAQTGRMRISCAVLHPPGSCCHYGDKELSSEQIEKVERVIAG